MAIFIKFEHTGLCIVGGKVKPVWGYVLPDALMPIC